MTNREEHEHYALRDQEAIIREGAGRPSAASRTSIPPLLAAPEHRLECGAPHGFRDRHVGDESEVRGQHRTLAVGSFGETGGDDLEGRVGCGGGVALHVSQPDDDGVAAAPRSAPVEGLQRFVSFELKGCAGRVDWMNCCRAVKSDAGSAAG